MDDLEVTDLQTDDQESHSSSLVSHGLWAAHRAQGKRSRLLRRIYFWAIFLIGGFLLLSIITWSGVSTTTSLPPHADQIFFRHSAPWGQLRIDGKRVDMREDLSLQAMYLPRGRHSLQYEAPPFQQVHCTFSVPAGSTDTCPQYHAALTDPYPSPPARVFELGVTLDKLTASQREALLLAARTSINTMSMATFAEIGDHYTTPNKQVGISAHRFPIEFQFTIVSSAMIPNGNGSDTEHCLPLCLDPTSNGLYWEVPVTVLPQWTYVLPSGQLITEMPLASTAPDQSGTALSLDVTWNDGWQVAPPTRTNLASAVCGVGEARVAQLVNGTSPQVAISSEDCVAATNPADGCLTILTVPNNLGATVPSTARILYRFGLLLAANGVAHTLFPSLPIASNKESAYVDELGVAK